MSEVPERTPAANGVAIGWAHERRQDQDESCPASAAAAPPAGGVARLAAGLSLAATGFALASIPTALADPAADHGKPADGQSADTQAETAAKTFPGSRPADASRPNARARNGRPATLPTTDPAALPWDEIAGFMRQHSPLKWERWEQFDRAYSSRGAGGPARSRRAEMRQKLEEGIRDQYAQLKKIESADADEYQLMVRRVELEDKVFGAQAEFRRGVGDAAKQCSPRSKSNSTSARYSLCRTR